MNTKEHRQRHVELHKVLDELIADWIGCTQGLPSKATIMDLLEWSHKQAIDPTGWEQEEPNQKQNETKQSDATDCLPVPSKAWRCVSMHDPAGLRGIWFAVHEDRLIVRGGREGDDAWAEIQRKWIPGNEFKELVLALESGAWMQEDYGPNTSLLPFATKRWKSNE